MGAFLGLILGQMYDERKDTAQRSTLWGRSGAFSANVEQDTFTMGVIILGAKMAKCDGRVTPEEIEAFKRVFRVAPAQVEAVGALFDKARRSATGFEPYAISLARLFRSRPAVLEQILGGLFIIAAADRTGLTPAEMAFLQKVSTLFGFGPHDFNRIAARAGVHVRGKESACAPLKEAYVLLGVSENATNDQIKKAYRTLIREHHPDKLMAKGMPPAFVATATEKMKRFNAAYDAVCKAKGIK